MRREREPEDSLDLHALYLETQKIPDQGYPGFGPTTSQADTMKAQGFAANNTRGLHICDWCLNPMSPVIHDCYEKRNGIKLSEKSDVIKNEDAAPEMYRPHPFVPSQTGLIGAPCAVCGGLPTAANHSEKAPPMDQEYALKMQTRPAVWVDCTSDRSANYEIRNIPNDQAMRIISFILPKALELYLQKSKDYGGNVMDRFGLGQKAAIPDMARKFGKLIDAIWRDQPLQFEQPDEILMDLLGHILIILDQRAEGQ